ncbi:DUF3558 domain-containing protein [Rhodococcus chondri]|uniref:DUF3558 domain-containing protein n=1 Tax=Rhodococcus chondri TaxID=3065941 RepID=A0ABU7JMS4_9NOCA|nr:DUF3558 domain-containing protein [Rhodococcus sp. CC-R104]MEE2031336.1 DUF3558 domain-containing protein [Rhodococcus sp. CC-R104]
MGLVVGMTFATACGSGSAATGPDEPAEAATSTTRTPRVVDDSGRPQITFDPCLDIPDELLIEAGYDPKSEEVTDYPMGSYTFLSCRYRGTLHIPGVLRRYGLSVLSGNVSIEEELAKNGHVAREANIGGRRALVEIDPDLQDTCAYVLQTNFGIVILSRSYNADHNRRVPEAEWCANFETAVSMIEPLIKD